MRKYKAGAAIALSLVMGVSMLSGCSTGTSLTGSETTTEASSSKSSSTDNEENKVYGIVSSVSSDSVTIEVGTLNEQNKPDDKQSDNGNSTDNSSEKNSTDSSSDNAASNKDSSTDNSKNSASNSSTESSDSTKNSDTNSTGSTEKSSGEAPAEKSMITTTGETKTIALTSSTKVSQEMPGNPPQGGGQGNGQQPPQQNGSGNSNTNNNSADGSDSGSNSSDAGNSAVGGNNSSQNGSQEQPPAKPEKNNQNSTNNSADSSSSTEKVTDSTTDNSTEEKSNSSSESSEANSNSAEKNANSSSSNSNSGSSNESQSKELSVSDLKENDEVCITLDSEGNASEITLLSGGENGGAPQGGGQSAAPTSYTAATEYSEDKTTTGKTYSSTGTDENAVHVTNGAKVTLKDATVSRESEDSQGGDSSSFYGTGAAILTTDGTSYISGSKITTNANGGAGVFSYGDGTTYVSDTTISTKKDTSGGLHVAGGGKLYAWDVTATTQGESSAAIRSDRGGGTMVVDGGTYTSNGTGSPAVYSTADIAVHNADLIANNSESVCIEGLNSLRLFDCNLTGNMKDDSQNDCTWNVILYQSMSGDSEVGNSTFEMDGGTLTAKNGGMFYTTNTESTIRLSNVDITYAKDNDFFLKCTGNSNQRGWGTSGANGADCNFTADNQKMEGDVIWDSISQLDFYMSNGSTLKGAVTDDESNAGDGGSGYCNFYIAKGCTWTVTGDSTLTNLYNAGTIVDNNGKTVTIKGTDGTVYVKGDSEYTITVSSYSTKADMSGMTDASAWKDYETEKTV